MSRDTFRLRRFKNLRCPDHNEPLEHIGFGTTYGIRDCPIDGCKVQVHVTDKLIRTAPIARESLSDMPIGWAEMNPEAAAKVVKEGNHKP